MASPQAITSIRIISVDHYQSSPVIHLDHCNSRFRGSHIKQVPVIRIFGSTQNGDKICLHVHQVMPYIYIPYDSTVPRSEHDRFIYQVIGSLEKAINITLGQSSGQAQHVYDVLHVKGIPFYGYHPKDHQFLKIQFYNPYLTKKAASLLQNAAICGRVLQSFESHIPYILQFFMDYNLYGMSFVHVKTEHLVYRQQEGELLEDRNGLPKMTRCKLEADIVGVHILNYLSYGQSNQMHQNPGIAFIWEDEINRRKKLEIQDPVELPLTQDRPKAKVTESDLYFKSVLSTKLDNQDPSKSVQKSNKGGKFNLLGLLGNAVYPAECPEVDDDSILNASSLPHLVKSKFSNSSDLSFLNDTVVDEEVVLSISQRPCDNDETFDEDDLSMLQILEELENRNNPIDEDSILAPLSQKANKSISQSQFNRSQKAVLSQNATIGNAEIPFDEEEAGDESLNDLNMTLLNEDWATDWDYVPQLDGGDDSNCKSATKHKVNFESKTLTRSAKKKSRYAPLNLTVRSSPRKSLGLTKCNSEGALPTFTTRQSPRMNKSVKITPNVEEAPDWNKLYNIKDCSVALKRIDAPYQPDQNELPIALVYDLQNGISAEPGPSSSKPTKSKSGPKETPPTEEAEITDVGSDCEDAGMKSFYDKTLNLSASGSDMELSMSLSLPVVKTTDSLITNPEDKKVIKITPQVGPPDPEFVQATFTSYGLLDYEFEKPFYSNPKDVTKKKDLGGVLLNVKSKNYCEPFQSLLGGAALYVHPRKLKQDSVKRIRMTPHSRAPSLKDAQIWLKAREKMKANERAKELVEGESPVKMKRERTLMVLDGHELDEEEDEQTGIVFQDDPNLSIHHNSSRIVELNSSGVINTTPDSIASLQLVSRYSSKKNSVVKRLQKNRVRLSAAKRLDLSTTIKEDLEEFGLKPLSLSSESQNHSSSKTSDNSLLRDKNYLNLTSYSYGKDESQFTQPTMNNTYGFKMDLENLNDVKVNENHNHLVIFSLEIHTQTRDKLLPDPEHDSLAAVFYAICNDSEETENRPANVNGVIIIHQEGHSTNPKLCGVKVNAVVVDSELKLIEKLMEVIYFWDPDILSGYEIELASWGYLIARGQILGVNVPSLLSRVILKKPEKAKEEAAEDFDEEFAQQLKIRGRIVLDVWRLMRNEINLMSYTFESIMFHIMHRRYPKHSHADLTKWWKDPRTSWIVLQYYIQRTRGSLEILDQLDLIGRTCELAKLFGIQFFEVLSRGSQFRVESMMLRMSKPRNFIPISPSVQQRVHMRAPEYLPLILEPESRLYVDPVIVLDFQSLYPSMMIAYNYCFSTCLGRVEHLGDVNPFEFGASQLQISPKILKQLLVRDLITVSPAGIVFVKSEVREGTLPRMLKEILDTRIMVKNSMKLHKNNKLLQRVLHSRQLGLKLIANVTYGYTAANYSGRMSCVEVADSILSKARETLERAIKLVETNNKWNVKVVYGDTDSMFVLVPGRSKEEAFAIGEEIAQLITEDNPNPVKLKLEKVYQPCILQTKKRYVGYMYESKDQKEPVYEAKGIETVRRDGCPIVARMLEKVLRILFETKDVSLIKQYVNREFTKIIGGRVNIQDLTFGREFRGITGYKPNACVPALVLTRKWKQTDRRREPRSGERVPYVIANGSPGLPLIKLVRSPDELLADEGLKINSFYYILKAIIPPLNRCLLLIGVDVNHWFDELRRNNCLKLEDVVLTKDVINDNNPKKRSTISQYFSNTDCIINCGRQTKKTICDQCKQLPQKVSFVLNSRMQSIERKFRQIEEICQSCCGRQFETGCSSLDCPILFVRTKRQRKFQQMDYLNECLELM